MNSPSEHVAADPLRPSDHIDAEPQIQSPTLGFVGWMRWGWRQLTSMRTAIVLLLMLAIAAIPGSIFPQRTADPNGVIQYQRDNPDLFPVVDWFRLFDVYSSPWFSAIYILLFVSLIGCIIPRTKHHFKAMRSRPPRTPARLSRLEDYREDLFEAPGEPQSAAEHAVDVAAGQLKSAGYRVERYDSRGTFSVSAERGYLRETGNLIFHMSLVGVLVSVGLGSALSYTGQTVIREGETFVNSQLSFTSLTKGPFVGDDVQATYAMKLDSFDVKYHDNGQAGDFSANLEVRHRSGERTKESIQVNHPLNLEGDRIYLMGNGYAPTITVRDSAGTVVFTDDVPFLPQDNAMVSQGVVKITDGLKDAKGEAVQLGLQGFFYPTAAQLQSGAFTSIFPDLKNPLLTLNVFQGDLGINDGTPRNVYTLDTSDMTQIAGGQSEAKAIKLTPGETTDLPDGLGTITFDTQAPNNVKGDFTGSVTRYVSLSLHHDPTSMYVLIFAVLAFAGLGTALFVPRRRVWMKASVQGENIKLEYAGLARGEDPGLAVAVDQFATKHQATLTSSKVD